MSKNVQFIVDEKGQRTGVILPIEDYEEMLEDLHFGLVARESKGEERIPWEQIKAELIAEGKLDSACNFERSEGRQSY